MKKAGKILWGVIKALVALVIVVLIIAVLAVAFVYSPMGERLIAEKGSEFLSEAMEKDVHIGAVELGFPLDLKIRDFQIRAMGDSLMYERTQDEIRETRDERELVFVRELGVNVALMPLLKKTVEVDQLFVDSAQLKTQDLIESMRIDGHVGHLTTEGHAINVQLDSLGDFFIPMLKLAHSDITLTMNDSVPEDTTQEEPFLKSLRFGDVVLDDVSFGLTHEGALTDTGSLKEAEEIMRVEKTTAKVSDLAMFMDKGFELSSGTMKMEADAFTLGTAPDLLLEKLKMNADTLSMISDSVGMSVMCDLSSGKMAASGTMLTGKKAEVKHVAGLFSMFMPVNGAGSMSLRDVNVQTPSSTLTVSGDMDMNAFDDRNPGRMDFNISGHVGKADMNTWIPSDVMRQIQQYVPINSGSALNLNGRVAGNLKTLTLTLTLAMTGLRADLAMTMTDVGGKNMSMSVRKLNASALGMECALQDFSYSQGRNGMNIRGRIDAKVNDDRALKGLLPKDVAQMFRIPRGTRISTGIDMQGQQIALDNTMISTPQGGSVSAPYLFFNPETEEYNVNLTARNFVPNEFVSIPERTQFTGDVRAQGKGFDFAKLDTWTDADIKTVDARYGKYSLANTLIAADLRKRNWTGQIDAKDSKIRGHIDLTATTDMKDNHQFDVTGRDLYVNWPGMTPLSTQDLKVKGDLTNAKTTVEMTSEDMYLHLNAGEKYDRLFAKYAKVGNKVMKQVQDKKIDVSTWTSMLPDAMLLAVVGKNNIVTRMLAADSVMFDTVFADLRTSHINGMRGTLFAKNLKAAGYIADTLTLHMDHDSVGLIANAKVKVPEQGALDPFTAKARLRLSQDLAELKAMYIDKENRTGLDVGFNIQTSDSMMSVCIAPQDAILAYHPFVVNKDNYIHLKKKNRVFADVELISTDDDCTIRLEGKPSDDELQYLQADIRNLNLKSLAQFVPQITDMDGMLNGDVAYIQKMDKTYSVKGNVTANDFVYDGTNLGNVNAMLSYKPVGDAGHGIVALLSKDDVEVATVKGTYNAEGKEQLNVKGKLITLPMEMVSAFIGNPMLQTSGKMDGLLDVTGTLDKMNINGSLVPHNAMLYSDIYSYRFRMDNDTAKIEDSKLMMDQFNLYSANGQSLKLRGLVDFSNVEDIKMNLRANGKNLALVEAGQTTKSELFGEAYGDVSVTLRGSTSNMSIRGNVNLLPTTKLTYKLTNSAISMGDRLDDIVTFVDFKAPPDREKLKKASSSTAMDMNLVLQVAEGAKLKCIYSADGKSYVDVNGSGKLTMTRSAEGVMQMLGRYTISDGLMKYTNTIIPMKTFNIARDSYVEFAGEVGNPIINLAATESVKAPVSNEDGSSRMVAFNTGLKVTNSLNNLGLAFTIEAPQDMRVQNELAGMSEEDKNKLAVSMLATGMYLANSNSTGFSTTNAMNQFLQSEINNIAGKAIGSTLGLDMNVGMESSKRSDGSTKTDYSFKFTKRFFSDRLNVIVGGMVNTSEGTSVSQRSGTYINDVSLEWRLDKSGTRYARLFHDINYNNLLEGELTENGGGIVLRKKVSNWKDLWKIFQFGKSKKTPHVDNAEKVENKNR